MSDRAFFGYCVLAAFTLALLVIAILAIRVMTLDTPDTGVERTNKATYEVAEGDNLASISRETGVPVEEIESLNPDADPLALLPGQRLRLKPLTARERRRAALRRARRPRQYVVKKGDGLLGIAVKTDVSMARLRQLNKKKNLDLLVPGMRLRLRK